MAQWTRRQVIGTTAGVAVASLTAYAWNLHQHLPARDPGAEERFLRAQNLLLAGNGNTVHSRFVQIAEPRLRVQVLEGGQGEPVLLLHGGNGVAAQWEPLLSRLSSGFHIYAPDRPGCGLTDMFNYRDVPLREHAVNFVRTTMDALGLKTANLVGNFDGRLFRPCIRASAPGAREASDYRRRAGGQLCRYPTSQSSARDAWSERPDVCHRDEAWRFRHV